MTRKKVVELITKEPLRHYLMDELQRLTIENNQLKAKLDELGQGIDILTPKSTKSPK